MKQIILIAIIILGGLLRFYSLDKFPSGLNADEAAIGYNAYSLLQTGKDEHGVSWPLVFRSFDDYKPPLYFYLSLPFIKTIGLNVFAVRLPSALLGTISIWLIYLLASKLFSQKASSKQFINIGHIAAILLAFSPWHLHFSRGAWEVNLSTFLILLGSLLFINGLKKPIHFIFFSLLFVLSLYAYHSARVIAPLLAFSLLFIYRPKISASLVISILIGVMLAVPIGLQLVSKEGQSRFSGVSIFSDSGPLSFVHEMRRTSDNPNSVWTKLRYNRYSAYTQKFLENYLSHFSNQFLFIDGDVIDRSRVPGFGQQYVFLAPFFYLGILLLLLKPTRNKIFIIIWLLVSPIAASLTYQSPHALRSQNMVIPLTIITSYGIYQLSVILSSLKSRIYLIVFLLLTSSLSIINFSEYLKSYYFRYPKELPTAWQYGFEQLGEYIKTEGHKYDKIVISDKYDQPYILIAFFTQYDPSVLQKEIKLTPRDRFGFSTVSSFGKYEFRSINYSKDQLLKDALLVTTSEDVPEIKVINTIVSTGGQTVFKFISL